LCSAKGGFKLFIADFSFLFLFLLQTFLLGCPDKWKIRRGRIKVRLHDLTKVFFCPLLSMANSVQVEIALENPN
jgi:hypothetical protein